MSNPYQAKFRRTTAERNPETNPEVERVLKRLREMGRKVTKIGTGKWMCQCPVHRPDHNPSFGVSVGDIKPVVMHCLSRKCAFDDVVKALKLDTAIVYKRYNPSLQSREVDLDNLELVDHVSPEAQIYQWYLHNTPEHRQQAADDLGVSSDSLRELRVGWNPRIAAAMFPEHDGNGEVVGFSRYLSDGSVVGAWDGRRGLIIPMDLDEYPDPVHVMPSPGCVAAALDRGLTAIGSSGVDQCLDDLEILLADRAVVIFGENVPENEHKSGHQLRNQLSEALGREVGLRLPPPTYRDFLSWHKGASNE